MMPSSWIQRMLPQMPMKNQSGSSHVLVPSVAAAAAAADFAPCVPPESAAYASVPFLDAYAPPC